MASSTQATRQTFDFTGKQPKVAIRQTVEAFVYPKKYDSEPPLPHYEGWWERMKHQWEEATNTAEKKEIIAVCMIFMLVIAFLAALIVSMAASGSHVPIVLAAEPYQRPIVVQLREYDIDWRTSQSAETPVLTSSMTIASAPAPIIVTSLPSWATDECVLRIAGVVQGETGGLTQEAWYAVAQEVAWDADQCNYKITWGGGVAGTANEVHTYTFEKNWYGRTSKNDKRTLDAGMVNQVLEAEIRPEILKAVTQSLIDFGSDKARYPDCEFIDNIAGMIKRVRAGATIDYIFTGPGNRTTATGAEFFLNCPSGK